VRAAVVDSLRTCAAAVVAEPVNCPQVLGDASLATPTVTWGLHGDPVDGAQIVYQDDRFHVLGIAVMTADYGVYGAWRTAVRSVRYWAELAWQDGGATVVDIRGHDGAGPDVVKSALEFEWDEIAPALAAEFAWCASAEFAPMPSKCPNTGQGPRLEHAAWRLATDPLLNARSSYDNGSGLVTVTGSYAAVVTGRSRSDLTEYTQAGNYTATLVVEGGELAVLQIASV
jgi:hypothetical protein